MSRHPPQIAARATMRVTRARAAAETTTMPSSSSDSRDVVELPYDIWERIIARIIRSEKFGSYVQYDSFGVCRAKVREPMWVYDIVWEELDRRAPISDVRGAHEEARIIKLANIIRAKRRARTISVLRGTCQTFRRVMDGPIGRDVCREAWETMMKCCLDAFPCIPWPNIGPSWYGDGYYSSYGDAVCSPYVSAIHNSYGGAVSVYRSREAPETMSHENKLALFFGETCQMCGEDVRKNTVVYRGVQWRVGARVCDECLHVNLMAPPKRDTPTLIDGQPILEEHYKSLPKIELNGEDWYWRNSVLKNMEQTKERQRRLEEEKKERKALQMKRKRERDELQSVRDAKRDKRREDMNAILTQYVVDEKSLELSETYRKHAAMARPLTIQFRKTYLATILSEIPKNFHRLPNSSA